MTEQVLAGRYKLLEEVGRGGMAIVYRAMDLQQNRLVAVKVLRSEFNKDAEFVARFQREAEATNQMHHHNIVNLLDVGMEGASRFLVMEYVAGQTLKDLIQKKGQLSPQEASAITIRILAALQHAHTRGIIHRDIKPQNILISEDGTVKVTDFGIARMVTSATLTKGDYVMGSVHYFSPEQAAGGQETSARSDLYSVGVVLYEMLTGHVPYDGETLATIGLRHLKDSPPPIARDAPGTPPALVEVVMIAMAKRQEMRYPTAAAFAMDIQNAMNGLPLAYSPVMVPPQVLPPAPALKMRQRQAAPAPARSLPNPARRRWLFFSTVVAGLLVVYCLVSGFFLIYDQLVNNVVVPDLVGQDLEAAQRSLDRLGLLYRVTEVNNATSQAGKVLIQGPSAGGTLRKGDTVTLTVSKGPASQTVPRLVGTTVQAAVTLLQQGNLTMSVMERVVSSEPVDVILTQSPEEGADCQPGDMVQVTVSGGSAFVPILRGKTITEAKELVESAKLVLNTVMSYIETSDASLHGTVADQSPAADVQVVEGTMVTLTLYRYPALVMDAQVQLSLPESGNALQVRVTLIEKGVEREVYAAVHQPGTTRNPMVTLDAQEAGRYTYRVYLNGQFAYQQQVDMQ